MFESNNFLYDINIHQDTLHHRWRETRA